MNTDAEIRQQGYIYFLSEAPELIELIEQELFSLSSDYSIAKVHNLMRATHTIKGSAANVGLEVIQTVAHYLESIFKALYNPDVVIDTELQGLLLQAYECLHIPLTAEIAGTPINDEQILQQAAAVFAKLQEKLGDAFNTEARIPTSEELGFDIVKSIFEVGVTQRLENIAATINHPPDNQELIKFIRSEIEVFKGLAESLNLPGFGAITHTILAALEANPTQAQHIAELALTNLQAAKAAVLAGDRTSGGEPSLELQQLATAANNQETDIIFELDLNANNSGFSSEQHRELENLYIFLTSGNKSVNNPLKSVTAQFYLKVIRYIYGWFNHFQQIPVSELNLSLIVPVNQGTNLGNYLENWLQKFLEFVESPEDSQSLYIYRQGVIFTIILAVVRFQYSSKKFDGAILVIRTLKKQISQLSKKYKSLPPVTLEQKNWIHSPHLQKLLVLQEISPPVFEDNTDNLLTSIWAEESMITLSSDTDAGSIESFVINEENLTEIHQPVIELQPNSLNQINQQTEAKPSDYPSKKLRNNSLIRVDTEGLDRLNYLAGELLVNQKRRSLQDEDIKYIIEQLIQRLNRQQAILNQLGDLPLQIQNITLKKQQNFFAEKFDSLEMDIYTEFQVTLHEAIEENLQIQETTESLDLLLGQVTQINVKQQNLVLNIIDNLIDARMMPLGNILHRFSQMVTKLGTVYNKFVELKLTGTEVLVDKAIAEKLYEPLLHLVRNAFDHGIESPQVRRELGKSEQGLIEICAYHQGSQTIIEVRDDGQGLNLEKIRRKAIELNLIPAADPARGYGDTYNESELLELMFSTGFSTADQVSEISGRGIGLDIVRSQLQALNGSISVETLSNQGTKFILKIPFSMTTDKLMLVQAGDFIYGLLLDSIEKILIPTEQQINEFDGKKVLYWNTDKDERMIRLLQLSELMSYNCSFVNTANSPNISSNYDTGIMKNTVILLRRNEEIFGLEVNQIIGEQELVIRPLGNAIAPPKYVYACSSLPNGNLILVIDGALLLESYETQTKLEVRNLPAANSFAKKALPQSGLTLHSTPLIAPSAQTNYKSLKLVLVVDDALSLRQTLTLTLQKFGYQVLQAQNGLEALEYLQNHPEIHVVISDLEMPRMNGFELLSNIRQNPKLAKKPVVILTSRSADKHRQLAQELGANAYLIKPYLEDQFVSTVEGLINENDDLNQLVMNH